MMAQEEQRQMLSYGISLSRPHRQRQRNPVHSRLGKGVSWRTLSNRPMQTTQKGHPARAHALRPDLASGDRKSTEGFFSITSMVEPGVGGHASMHQVKFSSSLLGRCAVVPSHTVI